MGTDYMRAYDRARRRVDEMKLRTDFGGLENPYLETVSDLAGESLYDPWPIGYELLLARRRLVKHYAWAIPDEPALKLVGETGKVVEIGAGGGYWTALLRNRDVEVHAYDPKPANSHYSEFLWTRVKEGAMDPAGDHPDCTLFLCWPSYESDFADVALANYVAAGGERVAYVGEDESGCCADDAFFKQLRDRFEKVDGTAIPRFPGIHDYLTIWVRRR